MQEQEVVSIRTRKPYKTRSDKGSFEQTERDTFGLRYVAEMQAVRYEHLCDLFGWWKYQRAQQIGDASAVYQPETVAAVRSIINRWKRAGLIVTLQPFRGEPVWVSVTRKGMEQLGFSYVVGFPRSYEALREQAHLYQTSRVRLRFMQSQTYGGYRWIPEQAILIGRGEARRRHSYEHRPDALLVDESGGEMTVIAAVEVELTRKSYDRLSAIMHELLQQYPYVLYVVVPELVPVLLEGRAYFEEEAQRRIEILTL